MLQVKCPPSGLPAMRLHPHPLASGPLDPEVELAMVRLHRAILAGLGETRPQVVQFTGAAAGVGTTRIVLTLAEVLAGSGHRVGSLDLSASEGSDLSPAQIAQQVAGMDAGTGVPRPEGPSTAGNLAGYVGRVNLVLFDTAPLRSSALSMAITSAVGGTVLVVEAERTTDTEIRDALSTIGDCGGRCLGLVFNKRRRYFGSRR